MGPPQARRPPSRGRVRRLPLAPRPYPCETLDSYLQRLAQANHCQLQEIVAYLRVPATNNKRPVIDPERLATASGHTSTDLARALPELLFQAPTQHHTRRDGGPTGCLPNPRAACRRCALRRSGTTSPIQHWVRPHNLVCLTHQRWLGQDSLVPDPQLSLLNSPQVLHASRRHGKLIRRHGHQASAVAYAEAVSIVHRWCQQNHHPGPRRQLLDQLTNGDRTTFFDGEPSYEAACYPEVVALTSVLSSPTWRGLALSPHPAQDRPRFFAEVGRRLGRPGLGPGDRSDPILQWVIRTRAHQGAD